MIDVGLRATAAHCICSARRRPNSFGSFAMFAAIRRASSHIRTFACRASFASCAEVDVGERLAVRVGHDERLLKLADGPGRGEAARRSHAS